jgi:hypothetical protein
VKNTYITSNKQKLDTLFNHIADLRKLNNPQLEAQWATYLTIRLSGFLETSIRHIFLSYCDQKAHPKIIKYIGGSLEASRSQNMKPDVILNLAGSFNKQWKEKLDLYLVDDGRKEAIESIINIRNSAAHGGASSITYSSVKEYYEKIWDVIIYLDNQCSNDT